MTPKVDTALRVPSYFNLFKGAAGLFYAGTGPRSFSLNKSKHETLSKWGEYKSAIRAVAVCGISSLPQRRESKQCKNNGMVNHLP
jgi:hypothetical protein